MKRQISIQLLLLLILAGPVVAQDTYTISGYIKCGNTGEELIGSTIFVEELNVGYENKEVRMHFKKYFIMEFEMEPSPIEMD